MFKKLINIIYDVHLNNSIGYQWFDPIVENVFEKIETPHTKNVSSRPQKYDGSSTKYCYR